jgi:hypothetical protein
MNDTEIKDAYNRLVSILKENGLEWVTAQVSEQIRIGKTVEREIETLKDVEKIPIVYEKGFTRPLKKGPKELFPVSVKFEPAEQLELLIDAIEISVIETAYIENAVVVYFEKEWQNHQGIIFISDDLESKPISLNAETSKARFANTSKLKDLLDTLRKEVKNR